VIFGIDANPRYPDAEQVPRTVLINPVLTPLSTEVEDGWEGCLSVPGLRGWCRAGNICATAASTPAVGP
jgi:peptide deformylase